MKKIDLKLVIDQKVEDFSVRLEKCWKRRESPTALQSDERHTAYSVIALDLGLEQIDRLPLATYFAANSALNMSEKPGLMCVNPVYLHADLTSLVLFSEQHFTLSGDEADALIALLRPSFVDEGLSLTRGERATPWFVHSEADLDYVNTPPFVADGQDLRDWPAEGADRKKIMRITAECQMRLHDSSINQQRSEAGQLPINSIWFWGKGEDVAQTSEPSSHWLVSEDPLLQALSHFATGERKKWADVTVSDLKQAEIDQLILDLRQWPEHNSHLDIFDALLKSRRISELSVISQGETVTYQRKPWWSWR